ncbi:MAG: beta-lactamase regulating signal transducer with metallopeptidase domain, partial [Limisphaerales bacterium]
MSGAWWQSDWAVVVALLACEAALIGCVAWLAQRKMRSARRRLIVWQSALLAVFAVAVGELAGVGPSLVKALSQDTPEPWPPQAEVSTGVAIVTEEKPLIRELVEQRLRENQSANPPQLQLQFEEMESLAPVPTPPKASQSMTLGWVWLIGSASLLCLIAGRRVCFWFCSLRFRRVNCPQLRERLETVARRLDVKSRIDLRISHRLTTPAAYGLMRLTVGLPEDFESENSVERQEALLAHELAHLRAGDPWWHLGADLLTAALWWQPLVWWIAGSMKSASESAADEASLCVENGPEALAECLVEFGKRLTPRSAASAIGMAGSGYTSRLGQRVEALLDMAGGAEPIKPTFRQTLIRIGGAVLLASVGLTMVACCAPRSVGNAETPLAMTREAIAAQQPAAEIVVAAAPEPRERIDTAPAKKSSENRPEAARRVESDLTPGQTLEEARQLEQDAVLFEEGIRLADRGEVANAEAQKRAAIEGLTRARHALAKGFFEQQEFPEAIAQMDRLLRFVPKSATAKQYKTHISQTADKHVGRMASEEMLAKVPAYLANKKEVAGLIQDGKFLYEMRKFDEAKKRLRKAIELDP